MAASTCIEVSGGLIKRSVTIAGHRTSVSLEPVFWDALIEAAAAELKSINALVGEIDEARTTNLSSAIRVYLFARERSRGRAERDDLEPGQC